MGTAYKDYYKILGVDRKATESEIKAAFRKAARKYHPDLHAKSDKAAAEEQFKDINEAYTVLGDKEKRAQYDQLGTNPQSWQNWQPQPDMGGSGGPVWNEPDAEGFSDFFASLFGRQNPADMRGGFRPARNVRGQDLDSELELTLDEAYHGGQKTLQFAWGSTCPDCGGAGITGQKICRGCGGSGSKASTKTLDVKIPAYIRAGSKIRLKGQGSEGSAGGPAGDLLLTVKIRPQGCFSLVGNNLETSITIRPEQAVLGCQVTVPTMDGDVVLTVPPLFHNGKKLRLRAKGWPGKDGKRGDELVGVMIDIPRTLTATEQQLYQQLADLRQDAAGRRK